MSLEEQLLSIINLFFFPGDSKIPGASSVQQICVKWNKHVNLNVQIEWINIFMLKPE